MPAQDLSLDGRTLGHYDIVKKIGAGGMGVVYRAIDTRLNRSVAVKVLEVDGVDTERRKRFAQEARAASALNHPNIITIYDIGCADGYDFIAMEFVAGKTLSEILGHKPLPIADTLDYGLQVASALATAHAAGILHRDLKPANIMVTVDGLVKVLDFGLAKLVERDPESDATRSILRESPQTENGAIMGTAAYMSPEQAEGKPLDARSDIFSFGSVLYEMATGRRAFQGETSLSTLTAILRDDPAPLSEISTAPREIERIVVRCLRKDPARRFQTMADLRVALLELKEESESGKLTAGAPPLNRRRSRRWIAPIIAAVVILVVAAGWLALRLVRQQAQGVALGLKRLTFDTGQTRAPAISPDGKLLAYVSDRSGKSEVWLQQVDGGDAVQLTHGGGQSPAFSADGAKVAFWSSGNADTDVEVISILGGDPKRLSQGHTYFPQPVFSPDGASIAYLAGMSTLRIMPANGGQTRDVGAPAKLTTSVGIREFGWGTWSSDSRYIVFRGIRQDNTSADRANLREKEDWWLAPIDGGPAVPTGAGDIIRAQKLAIGGIDVPSTWIGDRVLFTALVGDNRNIWQLRISDKTGRAVGPAVQLTSGSGVERSPKLSSNGRLVFASASVTPNYYKLGLNAEEGKATTSPEPFLPNSASDNFWLNRDGTKMVYCSSRAGNSDVWIRDIDTGKSVTLIATPKQEHSAGLSADGTQVLYRQDATFWVAPVSGGKPQEVCSDCNPVLSPDGTKVLYGERKNPSVDRMFMPATGERVETFQLGDHHHHSAVFSPDGKSVAALMYRGIAGRRDDALLLAERETGQLVIMPIHAGQPTSESEWITVLSLTGDESTARMQWSPEGNLLYWTANQGGNLLVKAVKLDRVTRKPRTDPFIVTEMRGVGSSRVQLGVARDKMVLLVTEGSSNIWMANLDFAH